MLISCPPPPPVPGPDEGGNGSGNETAKEFTVSFDANGGTGTIAPMKVKAGTEITLPDGTAFTRQYYTFNYWTISGLDFYEEGSKYTVKADTVFSAEWRHNQVEITYDSNDDTVSDPDPWWVDAGSDLILPGNPFGSSSPAGKYFHGWTTTATATEAEILAPGSSFRVEETDLTFYAYWGDTSVTEYKVTFSDTEMEQITFNEYTEEIRLPLYTGEPGIICKGWDTDSAAETVVYEDGGTIPKADLTGDIVLYPILEDVRVALTWEKNGAVSPDDSTYFPDRVAPGDFFFMAYAVTKDSGDGKVWILDSVTAKTVSGKTVPTRKEMMDGIAEVWHISVPAEATVITLNWEELTQLTVSTLTVYNPYEYYSNEKIISFEFLYSANSDPKTENLKITKDGKEVEIISYHYEFYTLEEKIGVCRLSAAEGAGNYLLQIVHKGNVVKQAAFTVENKGERTFTPTAGTPTQNTSGQWVIPVSFVFSNISHPGWLDYNVFLNDVQEELTRDTDYTTTISDDYTNMDFTFTGNVSIRQGDRIRITFTYDRSSPIQTKSVEVTIPTPPVPGPDEGGNGSGNETAKEFTVSFDTNGGTGTIAPMTAETGTAITLPSADGLSRQYYTFTAWETGEKQYNPGDQFTVNADTVFTAVWTRNTITVTYEANHESVTSSPYTETVDAGRFFRLPENPFGNSPDGQILYGWALTQTPEEFDILIKPNTEDIAGEADITFYAVWKEPVTITLTYIKNGAEASPEYQEDAFPGTAIQGSTVNLYEVFYVKDDGTDTPYILTGIKVTETESGTPVNVTKSDNGKGSPCWSFQAGTEPLTVALLWEVQSIDIYTFNDPMVYCEGNSIEMGVLTDIALSPGMITVTDEAGKQVIPSQKTAICVEINGGIRTYSCYIEFAENIPAGGTYKVIFTVSGKIIHTETVTVPEETQP